VPFVGISASVGMMVARGSAHVGWRHAEIVLVRLHVELQIERQAKVANAYP